MKTIDESIKHIENWLKINEENQKSVPTIKKLLRMLKWQRDTLKTMPQNIKNEFSTMFFEGGFFQSEYDSIIAAIPESKTVNVNLIQHYIHQQVCLLLFLQVQDIYQIWEL